MATISQNRVNIDYILGFFEIFDMKTFENLKKLILLTCLIQHLLALSLFFSSYKLLILHLIGEQQVTSSERIYESKYKNKVVNYNGNTNTNPLGCTHAKNLRVCTVPG